MSLRWRIALALAGVAAVVGTLAAAGAYLATRAQLEQAVDDSLESRAAELTGPQTRDRPDPPQAPVVLVCPPPAMLQPAVAVQYLSTDTTVTTCLEGAPTLPVDDADLALASGPGEPQLRTVEVDDERLRLLTAHVAEGTAVQIARDLAETEDVLGALRARLALLAASGVVVAAALGWLLASRIVRPVVELRDTAESIASSQDLTTPIPEGGPGEVGDLSASLTTMVHALATSREQQQRLIRDASHEMRTPLTSLRTNLEMLEHLDRLPATDRVELLAAVQGDVGELTHLLTELVELAADRAGDDEPVRPVDLGELAEGVAARFSRRTGHEVTVRDGVTPGAGPADAVLVEGRSQMLERAVANLVDNACKYSPPDGPVEIVVQGGRLEVLDRGPGIAEADRPHVFERFYRATEARSAPGSGLGLAIVAQIVERHGGRVWAVERPGGGAAVGFELPRSPEADDDAAHPDPYDRVRHPLREDRP
ncbi:MAG: HAMP domain-containing histidine kinase [Acidimicrobiales bacterium]|jgi:two-component system sensor histidine kinase MprB|nr:HAMP domain-containing histidine kinase [Acidimicrobiales bacterium]